MGNYKTEFRTLGQDKTRKREWERHRARSNSKCLEATWQRTELCTALLLSLPQPFARWSTVRVLVPTSPIRQPLPKTHALACARRSAVTLFLFFIRLDK